MPVIHDLNSWPVLCLNPFIKTLPNKAGIYCLLKLLLGTQKQNDFCEKIPRNWILVGHVNISLTCLNESVTTLQTRRSLSRFAAQEAPSLVPLIRQLLQVFASSIEKFRTRKSCTFHLIFENAQCISFVIYSPSNIIFHLCFNA